MTKRMITIAGRLAMAVAILAGAAGAARADDQPQNQLGGHFGAVFPIVTHVSGSTTTIGDDFKVGFPTGLTLKRNKDWAFDLELVPVVARTRFTSLTVHPGVIRALPNRFAAGMRMAFDVRENSWGFTPLINRGFTAGGQNLFIEGVMPIRFQEAVTGANQTSIGFGLHLGVGF